MTEISCARMAARAVALSLLITVIPSMALAQYVKGTVTQIIVQSGGVVFFNTSSTGTGRAACATYGRWAFSVNSADGQAMLSTLLTRQAAQKAVTIVGKGTCTTWPDSEDVSLVITQ